MIKTYAVLMTEEHNSVLYITAETPDKARERAADLIANGTPSIIPDMFSPSDIKIDHIHEHPSPDDEVWKNARDNDDELAELAD
jgi:hypothetical protein